MKNKLTLIILFTVMSVESTQDHTQQLPPELKKIIAGYISSAGSIEEATENIRSFMSSNKVWGSILNDQYVVNDLIQDLSQRFNVRLVTSAAMLRTQSALAWIREEIQDQQIAVSDIQNEMDFVIKASVRMPEENIQFRDSVIRFLYQAGATVDNFQYLKQATDELDIDLVNLLINLGNRKINVTQNGQTYSPLITSLLSKYALTKNVQNKQNYNKATEQMIKFLLKNHAVPTERDRKVLMQYGLLKNRR